MLNNIVKFEKLYSFLLLYKRSFDENFTGKEELLKLSKEIAKIEDEEYESAPKIVKKIIDIVRIYEFEMILSKKHHSNNTKLDDFWAMRIAEKVSQIKEPINLNQKKLIIKAKKYVSHKKS